MLGQYGVKTPCVFCFFFPGETIAFFYFSAICELRLSFRTDTDVFLVDCNCTGWSGGSRVFVSHLACLCLFSFFPAGFISSLIPRIREG